MNEDRGFNHSLETPLLKYLWASSPLNLNFVPDYHQYFKKMRLLDSFTDHEIRIFTRYLIKRVFQQDEVIFHQGETGYGIYFIFSGLVTIYSNFDEKNSRGDEILTLKSSEYFGEMGLLENFNKRTASAVAKETTVLLGLFKPDLEKLLEQHPVIGAKFLRETALIMAGRIGDLTKEMMKLRKIIVDLEKSK